METEPSEQSHSIPLSGRQRSGGTATVLTARPANEQLDTPHDHVSRLHLTVLIPTYNDGRHIEQTLAAVCHYLDSQPYHSEIVVVDDASDDETVDVARDVATRWPALQVLTLDEHQGQGTALRYGVLTAKGAYLLIMEAGLSTPIDALDQLLPHLESGYDVAIGSRAMPESTAMTRPSRRTTVTDTLMRRLVIHSMLPTVRDSGCAFKAYRTTVARHVMSQTLMQGDALDAELLLLVFGLGYQLIEVGVPWSQAPQSAHPSASLAQTLGDFYHLRHGVGERLDAGLEQIPDEYEPGVAVIALRQTTGAGDMALVDDLLTEMDAGWHTTVLARRTDSIVLAAFALTAGQARTLADRLSARCSQDLAQRQGAGVVSSEVQFLPLETSITWLTSLGTATAGTQGRPSSGLLDRLAVDDQRREAELRVAGRRQAAWARRRRTLRVLVAVNFFGLLWWLGWLFNFHDNAANPFLYTLLVLAECFNIIQVLGFWLTVWHERPVERKRARVEGRVDVFVTTFNEPVALVEKTLRAALAIPYPHRTYLLDDGNRLEMGRMAARLGARWITRPDNSGAKAGNINHALGHTDGDFFVVFDADHVPAPQFLSRLMPYMDDPTVAFVQAPQYYANREKSYIAGGAMEQQELFFGPICNGKDGLGAMFCCGTNMVFRRAAIDSVGGMREDSITEDAVTSLDLHEKGWTSRYVDERLADGLAPEDLGAYVSQQRRWARGNIQMLLRFGVLQRRMPWRLRFQYAWSAMHYLTGLTTVLYLILPCLYLLFGIQTVSAGSGDFIGHFLPYIFITIFILARSTEGQLRFRAMQLTYGSFPIFLGALSSVLTGARMHFVVTPKAGRARSFYHLVVPQISAIGISLIAIIFTFLHPLTAASITNACWAGFNIIMLSAIVRAAGAPRRNKKARGAAIESPAHPVDTEALSA